MKHYKERYKDCIILVDEENRTFDKNSFLLGASCGLLILIFVLFIVAHFINDGFKSQVEIYTYMNATDKTCITKSELDKTIKALRLICS